MTLAALGSFRPFSSVFRPPLPAVLDPLGIEHAAQDVVAHAREILHASAADHHHGVLLKVMALAGDVADHLEAVGQPHLGDLAQRRIRLLRGRGVDPGADAALLRRSLQRRHLVAALLPHPRLADQLVDRRHRVPHPISRTRISARPGLAPTGVHAKRNRAVRSWAERRLCIDRGPRRGGGAVVYTRSLTKLSEAASEFLGSRRFCRRADGARRRPQRPASSPGPPAQATGGTPETPGYSAAGSCAASAFSAACFSRSSRMSASRLTATSRTWPIMAPVPAGISRPTMTFSLSPSRVSTLPFTAASVSTRVVSWNEAAEMNERVCSEALVIPSSTGCALAGLRPSALARSLTSSSSMRSICSPWISSVSPDSSISTFCSIWRTITSMCLSLILTPCRR